MRQISDERIEHLSCEAVTQPWLRVSGDQVRAIIDRLRAAEADRDKNLRFYENECENHKVSIAEWHKTEAERDALKVRFEETNRCAEQMSKTVWSLEAERDAQAKEIMKMLDEQTTFANKATADIEKVAAERDEASAKVHELNRVAQEMNETAQKLSARQAEEVRAAHAERDAYRAKLEQVRGVLPVCAAALEVQGYPLAAAKVKNMLAELQPETVEREK